MKPSVCSNFATGTHTLTILQASSSAVRVALNNEDDRLRTLLTHLDSLRGHDREEALEFLLGVTPPSKESHVPEAILESANHDSLEDFKRLAEAIRTAVEKPGGVQTGLDWNELNGS